MGLVGAESTPEGVLLHCDCGAEILLVIPVPERDVPREEQAVTCDVCGVSHWFTIELHAETP
jgi:hypothetical protein